MIMMIIDQHLVSSQSMHCTACLASFLFQRGMLNGLTNTLQRHGCVLEEGDLPARTQCQNLSVSQLLNCKGQKYNKRPIGPELRPSYKNNPPRHQIRILASKTRQIQNRSAASNKDPVCGPSAAVCTTRAPPACPAKPPGPRWARRWDTTSR